MREEVWWTAIVSTPNVLMDERSCWVLAGHLPQIAKAVNLTTGLLFDRIYLKSNIKIE